MKVIKSSVELFEQGPGILGMFKFIERCGRIAYKSEDKISDDSWDRFCRMLTDKGHWAVLEHGTVYLAFPVCDWHREYSDLFKEPFCRIGISKGYYYVTTNYRYILQNNLQEVMEKYWEEPGVEHYHRLGAHWICSRATSHQLVRHRGYCLAGDCEIFSSSGKRWKIEELFNWKSDKKRKGALKKINIASVDENTGVIGTTKIKDIIQTGVKPVYKVMTKSGRYITTTLEHQYYVGNGEYKPLSDLKVGDKIMANGLELLDNEEWLRDFYLTQNHTRKETADFIGCCESNLYKAFVKYGIKKNHSDYPNRQAGHGVKGMHSEEEKKRISERMSLENNPQWKEDKKEGSARRVSKRHYKKDYCELCGSKENLEQHHWDKNPLNWKEPNLVTLCRDCHHMIHTTSKATKAIFSDEIVSITYVGDKMCYDLEVVGPFHNFVSNGLVVHNCFIQESQRYCNYGKDKFGKELTYILPSWAYRVRDDIGNTVDTLTGDLRSWILELDGQELWDALCCEDRTVASRDRLWKQLEDEYFYELSTDEGENLKPEEARGILCNDTKTELIMTGYLEDWFYSAPSESKEKAGFFTLRCAHDAQSDIRGLAENLRELMIEKGYNKWK